LIEKCGEEFDKLAGEYSTSYIPRFTTFKKALFFAKEDIK
jgi:hypothetical protein